MVSEKNVTEFFLYHEYFKKNILSSVRQEVDMQQILSYTIQVSILILCANIRKRSCVVLEKNMTEFFSISPIYITCMKNILSSSKQEVDMRQIQNCLTRYSSPYWCSVPNIRKLAYVVPEKSVTEILWRQPEDDTRRQIGIPYMSPLRNAGDTTMSADGSHLGWRMGYQIKFCKGTTQEPFHLHLVLAGQAISEEQIFKHFSHWVLC